MRKKIALYVTIALNALHSKVNKINLYIQFILLDMKNIKNALLMVIVMSTFGCGLNSDRGELVGVRGRRPWFHPQPLGTVYVPTGTFHAGQADNDIFQTHISPNKQ